MTEAPSAKNVANDTAASGRTVFISMALILVGVAFFGLANGGLFPLIGVHLANEEGADFHIGLISSTYYIGTLLGAITAGRIIARLQYSYAFVLFAGFAALSTFLLTQIEIIWAWIALRMLTGYCMGAYYLVIESWINFKTRNTHRGRSMAFYESVRVTAVAISPGLLNIGNEADAFILASILFAAAILPIWLLRMRSEEPAVAHKHNMPSLALFKTVPIGPVCCVMSGMMVGSFYGFSAVFGERAGLTSSQLTVFIAVAWIAPLFTQIPIGWCADRFGRQKVILGASLLAAIAAFAIALQTGLTLPLLLFLNFLMWGASHPIYALGVSYMNDRLAPSQFVRSSATSLVSYGLGTAIGPILTSALTHQVGNSGLYFFIGGSLVLLIILVSVLHTARKKPVPAVHDTD